MTIQKLKLQPGVVTEATPTLAEGTWSETNLVRWRDGFLEKLFGWTALAAQAVAGVARSLHSWVDTHSIKYMAIGTNTRLQVLSRGTIYDITPLRDMGDAAVAVSTTSTSSTVTITDVAHGGTVGEEVLILVPIAVGGIILQGYYTITEIVDADNYKIDAGTPATSTVVSGGAVPVYDTTSSDNLVKVTLAAYPAVVAQSYTVHISTTVGGLTLFGDYIIDSIIDADHFYINAGAAAGSTATASENGGDARYEYLIPPGPVSTTVLSGYGAGPYGFGPYGVGASSSDLYSYLRYWFLDNFGVTLIACISNGAMYEWDNDVTQRATVIAAAPTISGEMFISMPAQIVVSLASEVLGVQDPLLVRWCDAGDYNDWVASSANQAGSYRLSQGARIIGGIQGPLAGLIWTDAALWQMQYLSTPLIFSFNLIATGCGLVAPLAMAVLGRDIYWMAQQGFYVYGSGAPTQIPCAVWDTIFQDIDQDNVDKCIAAANSHTNEISWFYPSLSGGTGEIDAYVKYNVQDKLWDYGPISTLLKRTAWSDDNVFGFPASVDLDGHLWTQESGYNAGAEPMVGVRAKSGFIDIDDGQDMMRIDQIIPDFIMRGTDPSLEITLYCLDQPNSDPVSHGPFTVTPDTTIISILPPARGRQIAVEVTSDDIDVWWRLGAVRLRTAPDGRRPSVL